MKFWLSMVVLRRFSREAPSRDSKDVARTPHSSVMVEGRIGSDSVCSLGAYHACFVARIFTDKCHMFPRKCYEKVSAKKIVIH